MSLFVLSTFMHISFQTFTAKVKVGKAKCFS